jgi:hypothetical protein
LAPRSTPVTTTIDNVTGSSVARAESAPPSTTAASPGMTRPSKNVFSATDTRNRNAYP